MSVIKSFELSLKARRQPEDLLRAGKYSEVNQLIREGIKKKRFSFDGEDLVDRKISILEIKDLTASQDVVRMAKKMALRPPSMIDAFLMGEKFPDEQLEGPIVFLHEPEYAWNGHLFQVVLGKGYKGRMITLVSSGGYWHDGYRFAFRGK